MRALAVAEPPLLRWADRAPGGTDVRHRFERDVLDAARQALRRGDTEHAVRLLTDGINGVAPSSANTPSGLARRIENARAMQALLVSSEPFPALDEARVERSTRPRC